MDLDKIKEAIQEFRKTSYINLYEWETALLIYEFFDDDVELTDEQITKVYDMVHSEDNIFDEYLREEIRSLNSEEEIEEEMNI